MPVFLAWRAAAFLAVSPREQGLLWLGLEVALLGVFLALVAVLYSVVGVASVHHGRGSRWCSALGGGVAGGLAGLALASMGVFELAPDGVLNSALAGFVATVLSGLAAGALGHAGWFPHASIDE